jgi:hypothetical protein
MEYFLLNLVLFNEVKKKRKSEYLPKFFRRNQKREKCKKYKKEKKDNF